MNTKESDVKENIARIQEHIYGYMRTCVIHTFAELKIPDIIYNAPKTLNELATATNTDLNALKRLLRCAKSMDLVSLDVSCNEYHLLQDGEFLRSDHPFSQCNFAKLMGSSTRYQPWGNLTDILKEGNSKNYSPTYGENSLFYLQDKPDELEVFNTAMTNFSNWHDLAIVNAYDFKPFKYIIDMGCGSGTFIKTVLEQNPSLKGTMFDVNINNTSVNKAIKKRLFAKTGSFFNIDDIPCDCDLYTMKNVIHNFDIPQKQQILNTVATAMTSFSNSSIKPEQKRLLVIEYLLEENGVKKSSIAQWMDMHLFILNNGGELTLEQYKKIGLEAGLHLTKAIPTPIGRYIIEFKLS